MPNAAAPIAPRTASFLAISAPMASEKPSDEGFAAVLADKEIPTEAKPAAETGKPVPTTRQDLAAPAEPLPAKADGEAETDADETAEQPVAETIIPVLAMLTQPIVIAVPVKPVAKPEIAATTEAALPTIEPIKAEAPIEAPKAAAPVAAEPKAAPAPTSVSFLMQRVATPAPVDAAPAQIVAAPVTVAAPVVSETVEQPIVATVEPTIQAEPVQIAEMTPEAPIEIKIEAAKPEAPVARAAAPQPIVEARAIELAKATAETISEPAAAKPRARTTTASTLEALGMTTSAGTIDVRSVTAATEAASIEQLPQDRAAELIETIQSLRSEMKGDALDLSIDHKDYGPINVRFDRAEQGVTVRFDTRDADVAKLIADSTSALKAAGEQHGFRFERRDFAGAGTNSQDGAREGRTPARTADTILSNPNSPTRSAEDRSGIYA